MTGVTHQIDATQAVKAFDQLGMLDMYAVADVIGEMIVGQTKERIATEKTAPDGTAWAPWSAKYRTGRGNSKSLLLDDENLQDSIDNATRGSTIKVGTNLIQAATHQFGRDGIPARPYLGLSAENEADIEDLVANAIAGYLQ